MPGIGDFVVFPRRPTDFKGLRGFPKDCGFGGAKFPALGLGGGFLKNRFFGALPRVPTTKGKGKGGGGGNPGFFTRLISRAPR